MDIEINTLRGQSISFSTNSFRETLVYSDISFIVYVDHVQILANNLTQTKQVKLNETEGLALSYMFLKEEKTELTNKANISKPMLDSYKIVINDMCSSQGLESLAILYSVN